MQQAIRSLVLAATLGGVFAPATVAATTGFSPSAVRSQVESSMVVSGQVHIQADGTVSQVAIDREDRLPSGVVTFVRDSALSWQFEPDIGAGGAIARVAPMRLRVVAGKREDGGYQVSLRGVSFEGPAASDGERVRLIHRAAPTFPAAAARVGAAGTVYLLMKVGRDGRIEDMVAEQVNLRMIASEGDMARLRQLFAKSSMEAAHGWSFQPPSLGPQKDRPFWVVRVPVNFHGRGETSGAGGDDYGRWASYVPGPRQPAPWAKDGNGAGFSPDTLPDGGVYMADGRAPQLRTPLQGG